MPKKEKQSRIIYATAFNVRLVDYYAATAFAGEMDAKSISPLSMITFDMSSRIINLSSALTMPVI